MKKFIIMLIGEAGAGKSTFISELSEEKIMRNIAAKEYGGANTTQISTIYEFVEEENKFEIIGCSTKRQEDEKEVLKELRLELENNGFEGIFKKINDKKFGEQCLEIRIRLSIKKEFLSKKRKYDTIVVKDGRGLGDSEPDEKIELENYAITDEINTILFFSKIAGDQPRIFSKIVDEIMKYNLKTPMLHLRRDEDMTRSDKDFNDRILKNLYKNDKDLAGIIERVGKEKTEYRLNNTTFNIPEVKEWKGVLDIQKEKDAIQKKKYSDAIREIIDYSIDIYEKLYDEIVMKMTNVYSEKFNKKILERLLSDEGYNEVVKLVGEPYVKPKKPWYRNDRELIALKMPPQLIDGDKIEKYPYRNENSKSGNQYVNAIIPSYSYGCINFRHKIRDVVNRLIETSSDIQMINSGAMYRTFMDIKLEKETIETGSGYLAGEKRVDALNFNLFVLVRNKLNDELVKNSLVEENGKWKEFEYKNKFIKSEAIAVAMYDFLIESLELVNGKLNFELLEYISEKENEKIEAKMRRK